MYNNELKKINVTSEKLSDLLANTDKNIYHALKNSIYPGAKDESIGMVLAYCNAKKYDPLTKPVHIVPMSVKNSLTNKSEWRDVIMPGIASYRIDAERTGLYMGMSEPEYGPAITEKLGSIDITYPEWCKVVVEKYNPKSGRSSLFVGKEFWKENYANRGRDKVTGEADPTPNAMWAKRPYAQLAKCAEAQALRKAFPSDSTNIPSFEEMEGKEYIEHIENNSIRSLNTVINNEQLLVLKELIEESDTKDLDICDYLKINSLDKMTVEKWQGVCSLLRKKLAKKQKTDSLAINHILNAETIEINDDLQETQV